MWSGPIILPAFRLYEKAYSFSFWLYTGNCRCKDFRSILIFHVCVEYVQLSLKSGNWSPFRSSYYYQAALIAFIREIYLWWANALEHYCDNVSVQEPVFLNKSFSLAWQFCNHARIAMSCVARPTERWQWLSLMLSNPIATAKELMSDKDGSTMVQEQTTSREHWGKIRS